MLIIRIGGFTVSDLIFAAAALLLIFSVSRPKYPAQYAWPLAGLLALVAAGTSYGRSVDPSGDLLVAFRLIYIWIIWRWQARGVLLRREHIHRTLLAYLIGAALSALIAVAQVTVHFYPFGSLPAGVGSQRAPGLGAHVDDQGGLLAVAMAFGIALILNGEKGRIRRLAQACTLVCSVGLILSGTVTGMISVLVAVLFLLSRGEKRIVRLAKVVFGGAAVVWIGTRLQSALPGGSPLDRLLSATGTNGDVSTLSARQQTWHFAWQHIQTSPVAGVGMDTQSGVTYDGVTTTHNIFLLYWFQGGLVLLLALILVLVTVVRLVRRLDPGPVTDAVVAGAVAGFTYSMTSPIEYQRYFWISLVLVQAAGAHLSHRGSGEFFDDRARVDLVRGGGRDDDRDVRTGS